MCLKHGPLHPIPNRPVVSKARASLPLVLFVDRFLGGVFAKRRIPKRTQFGPVEAPLVPQSELQEHYIHLKVNKIHLQRQEGQQLCGLIRSLSSPSVYVCAIPFFLLLLLTQLCMLDAEKEGEKSDDLWLDLSDEESCNWLMFVRPAQNHLEQNLVAYQYGSEIFYATIKNIQPKQELKVGAFALLCVGQTTLFCICCTVLQCCLWTYWYRCGMQLPTQTLSIRRSTMLQKKKEKVNNLWFNS